MTKQNSTTFTKNTHSHECFNYVNLYQMGLSETCIFAMLSEDSNLVSRRIGVLV
jgi:hypothetical protein